MSITSNNTNVFAETVSGGGGGGGTPASSVVSQTSYSLSAAVGTSTDYARADHAHGTPAPAPGPGSARSQFAGASFTVGGAGLYSVGEGGGGVIYSSTSSTIVNNKLFADATTYSGDWSTIAVSLPYVEYEIYFAVAVASGDTFYGGFDDTAGPVGSAGVAHDQALLQIDAANNATGNFYLVTTDSAGGVTSINTGVTPAINTAYKLKIQFTTPTTVVASINNTVVATSTTNTPGTTVLMHHGVFCSNYQMGFRRMYAQDGI